MKSASSLRPRLRSTSLTAAMLALGCSLGSNLPSLMAASSADAPLTRESLKALADQHKITADQFKVLGGDVDNLTSAQQKLQAFQFKLSADELKLKANQEKLKALQLDLTSAQQKLASDQQKIVPKTSGGIRYDDESPKETPHR